MNLAEIRRETITIPTEASALGELATLAQEAREVLGYNTLQAHAEGKVQMLVLTPLQDVLRSLDIHPLNTEDVTAYKSQKWEEETRKQVEAWMVEGREHSLGSSSRYWSGSYYAPRWNEISIDKYEEPIPVHVLNKAVQIKKACPEAEIVIEALQDTPDPFLCVKHQGRKIYVEVWNEPRFEEKL